MAQARLPPNIPQGYPARYVADPSQDGVIPERDLPDAGLLILDAALRWRTDLGDASTGGDIPDRDQRAVASTGE